MIDQLRDLLRESRQRGFLGPGPVEEHLDHARAFAVPEGPAPGRALDLGAGGGLPGLVLAVVAWPEARWCFVDGQRRRAAFLEEAVAALGIADRVEVAWGRAEELGRTPDRRGSFDLVVARSFGPPGVTAECAAPFLAVGGRLVVSEPPAVALEERWPLEGLAELGLADPRSVEVPGPSPTHLATAVQRAPCPDRYPRRVGIPTKRPLF